MTNERKKGKAGSTFAQRLVMIVCTALVLGAILAGAMWGLYRLALANTSHRSATGWALAMTALVPLAGYVCYRLGKVESRGTLNGLAVGVKNVMDAANETANLKVQMTRTVRAPVETVAVELPPLPRIRRYSALNGGDVIDV